MTESEALKYFEDANRTNDMVCVLPKSDIGKCVINTLENQEKIKEAFEMWKAETGGYYGADDETTRFISTLNQILRSDEE